MDDVGRYRVALDLAKQRIEDVITLTRGLHPVDFGMLAKTAERMGRVLDGGHFHDDIAQGIEAGTAETVGLGPQVESPVA